MEDALQDGYGLLHAGLGFAFVVKAVAHGVCEEDAGLQILWLLLDQLAENLNLFGVWAFLLIGACFGGFDVEFVGGAGVALETHGFCEGLLAVCRFRTAAEAFRLGEAPVAHGAVRVDAHGLLKSLGGFHSPRNRAGG